MLFVLLALNLIVALDISGAGSNPSLQVGGFGQSEVRLAHAATAPLAGTPICGGYDRISTRVNQ